MSKLFEQIDNIASECRDANWDSYDAKPITPKTIELAKKIAAHLDDTWDACPCSGGELDFENSKQIISIMDFGDK